MEPEISVKHYHSLSLIMTFVYMLSKACLAFKANQANVPTVVIYLAMFYPNPESPPQKSHHSCSRGTPLSPKAANGKDREVLLCVAYSM